MKKSLESAVKLFSKLGSSVGTPANLAPFYGYGPGSPWYEERHKHDPISPLQINNIEVCIQNNYFIEEQRQTMQFNYLERNRELEFESFSFECGRLKINSSRLKWKEEEKRFVFEYENE